MSPDLFLQKFDRFLDAPDAVAKLRELILELAITGALVANSPEEAPIEYKSKTDVTPINTSNVPTNWRVVLLADAIKNRSGNSKLIKGKLYSEPTPERFQGFSASGADVWCDEYEHEGDGIIISAVGARCGKAFKATGKWCAIANTNITRPNPQLLDFNFAYLILNNEHFWIRGGSAQPFIKFPPSFDRHFALPPLAEQKRIVAKVDELMALCDRLEAQCAEQTGRQAALARAALERFAANPSPAELDLLFHPAVALPPADLRKSILSLAIQGKLVPQDPSDEPAINLLEQIATHKAALAKDGKLRGSTSVSPMANNDDSFVIPPNWCWVRFGEIMVNRDGERIPVSKEEREKREKTYDYYGASGVIDKIDDYLFNKPLLLIGEDGANLINRSTPIAFIARGKYWVNNHAHVLDGISEDFLQFIELHINAINLEKYVTGSAQPKMNQAKMNSIPIALPPLAEQRRIVAKVDELMALVDRLEAAQTAARDTATRLLTAAIAELTA